MQKDLVLFKQFENHYKTEGYDLVSIFDICLPFWCCKQNIIVEKATTVDRYSKIILNLIKNGIHSYSQICEFLGLAENDFATVQFQYLIKNNFIRENVNCYEITFEGLDFLNQKITIPMLDTEIFSFVYNDLTQEMMYVDNYEEVSDTKEENLVASKNILIQTHKLQNEDYIEIIHQNRPYFGKIEKNIFASFFNKLQKDTSFYDFEDNSIETHKRSIIFKAFLYQLEKGEEMKIDIRQSRKTVKPFTKYEINELLSKKVTQFYIRESKEYEQMIQKIQSLNSL